MTTEERLAKVERELGRAKRRSRWLLAALGLTAGAFALAWIFAGAAPTLQAQVGAGAERVVRANRFVLEDESGKPRAMLYAGKGEPGLTLFDENGKVRAMLSATADGSGLSLLDAAGKPCAGLVVNAGGSGLDLSYAAGKGRALLAVVKSGPGLRLYDENDKVIWRAP